MPPRSMKTPNGAIERTVPLTFWPTWRLLNSSSRFSRRSSYRATFSDRIRRFALRLTSRIFSRSFRPTNGWSFSAISWAASRGWSFWGRRGKSTIWLIGTKPRMPQSTMRPPLLWSMTGASMMTPASNCSCIERHLRSRPARRSERTAWPSCDSGWRT